MKIIETKDYPNIPRRVIRVVLNPDDPKWVHADGSAHFSPVPTTGPESDAISAFRSEFAREPEPGEWCKQCRLNWRYAQQGSHDEFAFTGSELQVALNKWGNPVHDGQVIESFREKTWDELYLEIDAQVGERVVRTSMPSKKVPALQPEVEPDWELFPSGPARMEGDVAKRRFLVLRRGVRVGEFIAEGADTASFNTDRDTQYAELQAAILAQEVLEAQVISIAGE